MRKDAAVRTERLPFFLPRGRAFLFLPLHLLFKAEETGKADVLEFVGNVMLLPVIFAEELHDLKSAFVQIKMNVAPLEIRGAGFPDFRIRVMVFDRLPRGEADFFY